MGQPHINELASILSSATFAECSRGLLFTELESSNNKNRLNYTWVLECRMKNKREFIIYRYLGKNQRCEFIHNITLYMAAFLMRVYTVIMLYNIRMCFI